MIYYCRVCGKRLVLTETETYHEDGKLKKYAFYRCPSKEDDHDRDVVLIEERPDD